MSIQETLKLLEDNSHINYGKFADYLTDDQKKIIRKIYGSYTTYLTPRKLSKLIYFLDSVIEKKLKGNFIEFGCGYGGVTALISSIKPKNSNLVVYDVFGEIPSPSDNDPKECFERYEIIKNKNAKGISGKEYYGYVTDLKNVVSRYLVDFHDCELKDKNITLIKKNIMDIDSLDFPISFAHIDVDWHDPTLKSLELISSNLTNDGIIVIDDYFNWKGAKKAVDDFLSSSQSKFIIKDDSENSLVISINKE